MATASRVLIVDDESIARESIGALLAGEGYELYFAANGAEGLAMALAVRPDALLLDVMMPGMDGFEVCRRLRAEAELAQIAIIMVTALDDRASRLNGLRAGVDEFLAKPFDSIELKLRLHTITRLGRYRRLLAERARFEWMVDQAEEGYLVLDVHSKIRYANPRACTYLGTATEALGQPFMTAVRLRYRPEPATAWSEWEVTGVTGAPCYLVEVETATARAFWLQMDSLNLPAGEDSERIVRLRNVTAQLTNYQDIRRFHTTVVHKLRTPLNAMHGSFSMLASYGAEMAPTEVVEFATMALGGLERLKSQIDDILQYINAGVAVQSSGFLHLAELGEHIIALATAMELTSLTVDLADVLMDQTLGLSSQALDSMLWEIFENSYKFHPQHAPVIEVVMTPMGRREVLLVITDNGITLTPDQLRGAWTPYFQGEKYFTGEAPGMGLGLPLVATLVWQVGGQVSLANRPDGPGVTVQLRLPLLPATGKDF